MGTILKIAALLLVIGGLWVWVSGRSVTEDVVAAANAPSLAASVSLAPGLDEGPFDQEGKILLDTSQGQGGTAYLLYTPASSGGAPAVKTKRLVFENRDKCAELNLPCATDQPGIPVRPDENVRVIGEVKNEMVTVREIYRL